MFADFTLRTHRVVKSTEDLLGVMEANAREGEMVGGEDDRVRAGT